MPSESTTHLLSNDIQVWLDLPRVYYVNQNKKKLGKGKLEKGKTASGKDRGAHFGLGGLKSK